MKRETQIRTLKVALTPEEITEAGARLANAHQQIAAIAEELKGVKEHYKAKASEAQASATVAAGLVANGYKWAEVECEIEITADRVSVVRLDTGEVVESRQPTPGERQMVIGE